MESLGAAREGERALLSRLRRLPVCGDDEAAMPESVAWRAWIELRRGRVPRVDAVFVRVLRSLLRRRTLGVAHLSTRDPEPSEHVLVDDPMLRELWIAYKRCISRGRTGPAAHLLDEIEARLSG